MVAEMPSFVVAVNPALSFLSMVASAASNSLMRSCVLMLMIPHKTSGMFSVHQRINSLSKFPTPNVEVNFVVSVRSAKFTPGFADFDDVEWPAILGEIQLNWEPFTPRIILALGRVANFARFKDGFTARNIDQGDRSLASSRASWSACFSLVNHVIAYGLLGAPKLNVFPVGPLGGGR